MMLRKYKRAIEQLPIKDSYEREDLVNDSFLYDKDGNIEIHWAPFDYINKDAKVFILGITPGWTQMELAFNYTRKNIKDPDETHVLKEAKRVAGFGGSMRKNLLHMLDEIGLPKYLSIDRTEQLFWRTSSSFTYKLSLEVSCICEWKELYRQQPKYVKETSFFNNDG